MENSQNLDQRESLELMEMIRQSALLDAEQSVAFDFQLRRMKRYQGDENLQILHSKALLNRMRASHDLQFLQGLSESQRKIPHFRHSCRLQEIFAEGLVLRAQKDSATVVHDGFLEQLFQLSQFSTSLDIQRATAALLLESVANCTSTRKAKELEKRFSLLPQVALDPEIRKMAFLAQALTEKNGRQPVVKVDLRQRVGGLARAFGRFIGLGDYRMRVWVGGSPRYKHLVVKVAARNEESARETVRSFMDEFLAKDSEPEREILDVFPPGSMWESGPYPVLKL